MLQFGNPGKKKVVISYTEMLEREAKRQLAKRAAKAKRKGRVAHEERIQFAKNKRKAKVKRKLQNKARAITRKYSK